MLPLHTNDHFSFRGKDFDLWLATCVNAHIIQRMQVYVKAARIGRLDVVSKLALTFDGTNDHNDALIASIVYEQFECADWIEHNTNVDMYFIEHIFNQAVKFDFQTRGENVPVVNNDKPFFQNWTDHQNLKKCRIQKNVIERELESNSNSRLRKM